MAAQSTTIFLKRNEGKVRILSNIGGVYGVLYRIYAS